MAYGLDGMSPGKVIRKRIWPAVGVFLIAASITAAYLAMQPLMDVGGFCTSGGPYAIRQPCPDTSWVLFVAFPVGFVGVGFLFAGYIPGGPRFLPLVWSALFIALGVNFLAYGLDPPDPATGVAWGWLICAVVFFATGGIPLAGILLDARKYFWDGGGSRASGAARLVGPLQFTTMTAAGADPAKWTRPGGGVVVDLGGAAIVSQPGGGDVTDSLERLAATHERGLLSDDEFTAAKARVLSEGPSS